MQGDIVGFGPPVWPRKVNTNVCPDCNGRGYTKDTAAVMKQGKTVMQGSGCVSCLGTGKTT